MQNPYPPYPPYPSQDLPNAGLSLTFGILSLCTMLICGCIPVGPVLAIIAILKVQEDRKLYRAEPGRYTTTSYNQSTGGLVTSIISLVLYGLGVLVFLVAMVLGVLKDLNGF